MYPESSARGRGRGAVNGGKSAPIRSVEITISADQTHHLPTQRLNLIAIKQLRLNLIAIKQLRADLKALLVIGRDVLIVHWKMVWI